jgi:hypothetical protein
VNAPHGLDAPTVEITPTTAAPGPSTSVAKLLRAADEARQVRAARENPDVVALGIERIRARVDRAIWIGIIAGLGFTMTTVQAFAANGAPAGSAAWWAAWVYDPMLTIILLALLMSEQVMARWLITPGGWVRFARWWVLAATYAMNTWQAWVSHDGGQIFLHSVPPLTVAIAAEAITESREGLTRAVRAALAYLAPTTEPVAAEEPRLVAVPTLEELAGMSRNQLRPIATGVGIKLRGGHGKWLTAGALRAAVTEHFHPDTTADTTTLTAVNESQG